MVIIYKASNIIEAHIVSGLLGASSIESSVTGDYLQGGVGEILTFDFAKVLVDEKDAEAALKIIAEYESAESE